MCSRWHIQRCRCRALSFRPQRPRYYPNQMIWYSALWRCCCDPQLLCQRSSNLYSCSWISLVLRWRTPAHWYNKVMCVVFDTVNIGLDSSIFNTIDSAVWGISSSHVVAMGWSIADTMLTIWLDRYEEYNWVKSKESNPHCLDIWLAYPADPGNLQSMQSPQGNISRTSSP